MRGRLAIRTPFADRLLLHLAKQRAPARSINDDSRGARQTTSGYALFAMAHRVNRHHGWGQERH